MNLPLARALVVVVAEVVVGGGVVVGVEEVGEAEDVVKVVVLVLVLVNQLRSACQHFCTLFQAHIFPVALLPNEDVPARSRLPSLLMTAVMRMGEYKGYINFDC